MQPFREDERRNTKVVCTTFGKSFVLMNSKYSLTTFIGAYAAAQQVLGDPTGQNPNLTASAEADERTDEFGILNVSKNIDESSPSIVPVLPSMFELRLSQFIEDLYYKQMTTFPGSEYSWMLQIPSGMQYNVDEKNPYLRGMDIIPLHTPGTVKV